MVEIEEQYQYIINWARNNNILLIDADVNTDKTALITLNGKEANSINDFTKLIFTLDGKVIFCSHLLFTEEDYNEYLGYVSKLENEEMRVNFKQLESYKNKILSFSFHFINNGAIYVFENSREEAEIWHNIKADLIDIIQNAQDAQENEFFYNKTNELGKQLANHEQFSKAKNRTQREFLAKKLFPEIENYGANAIVYIIHVAENIYEMEVKPQKEEQLSQKINQLKKEGKTKVVICRELQISKDTLNKYY